MDGIFVLDIVHERLFTIYCSGSSLLLKYILAYGIVTAKTDKKACLEMLKIKYLIYSLLLTFIYTQTQYSFFCVFMLGNRRCFTRI